jgi:hypothetical protein
VDTRIKQGGHLVKLLDWITKKKAEPQGIIPLQDDFVHFNAVSISDIPSSSGTTFPISKVKSIKPSPLSYATSRSMDGLEFVNAEYDLAEVGVIEDVESIVRQAHRKKIALMFKEGYDFVGKNKDTIEYVKARLAQIARASGIQTAELLKNLGTSLIRTSNAFLVKVRKDENSGGRIRRTPEGKILKPVAALFSVPAETMRARLDADTGKVNLWRQEMPDGRWKLFRADDVIHFTISKKDGFVFGTPDLIPVIDDIRALRKIEENVELLVYQHLFPLFHYKVGTETAPAGTTEGGDDEIEVAKTEIQYMPSEGGIVTPERHEIKMIGAEGRALRAESYITHFKRRVIAGLGISELDLGIADCYDEKTETLTENGWKKYYEIEDNEKIATYNPTAKQIEFHIPNSKYVDYYEGDMISFKGKHMDMKVTPHHRMWVSSRYTDRWEVRRASELYNKTCYQEFKYIDGAPWEEQNEHGATKVLIPANPKKEGKARDINCDIEDFAELIGYFVSEGNLSLSRHYQDGSYRVDIAQNIGSVSEKIEKCLINVGVSYTNYKLPKYEENRKDSCRFTIHSKALFDYAHENIGHLAENKNLPFDWKKWGFEARKKLFFALIDGDGTTSKEGTSKTYYTVSSRLADDVQELCLSLGLSAKTNKTKQSENSFGRKDFKKEYVYRVHISGTIGNLSIHNNGSVSKNVFKQYYKGVIYCFNVPNHFYVTRRNGKIAIQGNTSNRATARTLSRQLIDTVKSVQDSLEAQFMQEVISELLLESTFIDRMDVLDEQNITYLQFHEIDIENRIEQEKHSIEVFKANGLTYSEFRTSLGREPIFIPDDPNDQDPAKYPEWHQTHWKLFHEPEQLIRSIDEAFTPQAKAAAEARSAAVTKGQLETSKKEQQEIEKKRQKTTDAILNESYSELESDIVARILSALYSGTKYEDRDIETLINLWIESTSSLLFSYASFEFVEGFNSKTGGRAVEYLSMIQAGRRDVESRCFSGIRRLGNDIFSSINKYMNRFSDEGFLENRTQHISFIRSLFSSLHYRTDFIEDVEVKKASSYGKLLGMRANNVETVVFVAREGACDRCSFYNGREYAVADLSINDIVPLHANCRCKLQEV